MDKDIIKETIYQMIEDGELDIIIHHESGFYTPDINRIKLSIEFDDKVIASHGVETSDILRNI